MKVILQTDLFRRCVVCGAPLAKLAGRGRWQHVCGPECHRARARSRYTARLPRSEPVGPGPGPAFMVCFASALVACLVLTAAALWRACQ